MKRLALKKVDKNIKKVAMIINENQNEHRGRVLLKTCSKTGDAYLPQTKKDRHKNKHGANKLSDSEESDVKGDISS